MLTISSFFMFCFEDKICHNFLFNSVYMKIHIYIYMYIYITYTVDGTFCHASRRFYVTVLTFFH